MCAWLDGNRFARERQRVRTAADKPTDRKPGRGTSATTAENERLTAELAELKKKLRASETDGDEDAMEEDGDKSPAEEAAADEAKVKDIRKKIATHRSLLKQHEAMPDDDRMPEYEKKFSDKIKKKGILIGSN